MDEYQKHERELIKKIRELTNNLNFARGQLKDVAEEYAD